MKYHLILTSDNKSNISYQPTDGSKPNAAEDIAARKEKDVQELLAKLNGKKDDSTSETGRVLECAPEELQKEEKKHDEICADFEKNKTDQMQQTQNLMLEQQKELQVQQLIEQMQTAQKNRSRGLER